MKTLKQWLRGCLDWLALRLGYTRTDDAASAWRDAYNNAQCLYSIAQERLNKLMQYKKVQEQAKRIDSGRVRK